MVRSLLLALTALGATALLAAAPATAGPDTHAAVRTTPGQLVAVTCLSETACAAAGRAPAFGRVVDPSPGLVDLRDAAGWHPRRIQPPATRTTYYGVACRSTTSCVTVGEDMGGAVQAATWNGATWNRAVLPADVGRLRAVACPSPSSCIAVGSASGNAPGAATWDGTAWTATRIPMPAGSTSGLLEAVSCPTPRWCLATGRAVSSAGVESATVAIFDGTGWTVGPSPSASPGAATSFLWAVDCRSPRFCMATGITDGRTLAQVWDGAAWTRTPTPPGATGHDTASLSGVSCSRVTSCLAVGYSYSAHTSLSRPLVETWDGTTWATVTATAAVGSYSLLSAVSCTRPDWCLAVGFDHSVTATQDQSLAERWNGTAWVQEST